MGRVKVFFCLDSDILCSIIKWVYLISGVIQVIGGLSAFGECNSVTQDRLMAVGGFSGALDLLLCKQSVLTLEESKYSPVIIGFFHLAMCAILFVAVCQRMRLMFLVYLIVQIVSILVEIVFPFIVLRDGIKNGEMSKFFERYYALFIMKFISIGIQCVFLYIVFFHMSAVSPAPRTRPSARSTPHPSKQSSRTNTAQPSKRPSKQNVSRTTMKQGSQPNSTEV